MWWVVDRIEGRVAVLVSDSGSTLQLPRGAFREGQVYRFDGRYFRRNAAEERRRRAAASAQLRRMRATDPGGDIQL